MSPEIGSLDDVVRDDRMCTVLGERRFGELEFDDELTATMVSWCQDLDFGLDAFDDLPTPDLAKAAARRRAMQRGGRLVGAAAAVAAVCVGGLAVTHLTSSSATNSDAAKPVKSGAVSSPSMQTREQIWRDLSSARDALVRQDWSNARRLLTAASSSLPGVSADDGHNALQTWVDTLNSMLANHTTIEPTASLGSVKDADGYVIGDNGVPMLPGMDKVKSSATTEGNLPHRLPPLPDLDSPTGQRSANTQTQVHRTQSGRTGSGATHGGSSSAGSSAPGGSTSAGGHTGGSTPPSSGSSSNPPSDSDQGEADQPPLPPAPQIQINAPLLRQLLPQQPQAPSTSPSSLPTTSATGAAGSTTDPGGASEVPSASGSAAGTGTAPAGAESTAPASESAPAPTTTDQNG